MTKGEVTTASATLRGRGYNRAAATLLLYFAQCVYTHLWDLSPHFFERPALRAMSGLAGLLQTSTPQDTSAIDTFLRSCSQEQPTPQEEPAPSCGASTITSDEEPRSAHNSWVPIPYFAQRSGYNRLHVAMHAINEVCLMLWRMHAYLRYWPKLSTWTRRKNGLTDVK